MKFLHAMIRVNNLDESLRFYCDVLGMKLIRKRDYPSASSPSLSWDMVMRHKTR
jgi:catechol 2,3-dioxygenase-like lactoylglutathione lyase family enzyme